MNETRRPDRLARHTLRRAERADAAGIGDVFLTARAGMDYLPRLHSDEQTRAWIAHVVLAECEVWVAEADERVVGFAALNGTWLDHLYVAPGRQGAGIGSALLGRAMEAGARDLRVFERNEAAARFYERHGFTVAGRGDGGDNEERLPDVHYRRNA
ncbi:MAG TPA: GNAT family N-acetyltransferase [Glycomyces sp.]|nr:GNAT family N-acetyltransferase [Glycomyces sp.]